MILFYAENAKLTKSLIFPKFTYLFQIAVKLKVLLKYLNELGCQKGFLINFNSLMVNITPILF